jgi:CMP/dCMP kinase
VNRARPIIAIDGPGGAGKSTVARELAKALEMTYLNTGAMYRAVAVAIREAGIVRDNPKLEERIAPILKSLNIELDGDRVSLNGRDISSLITENEINDLASVYSAVPSVRERMRELQHATGQQGGVVMEGRDIGTVVFPNAELKIFLEASPEVRAQRRWLEHEEKGEPATLPEVLVEVRERDKRDRERKVSPLVRAEDAVLIDNTAMDAEETARLIVLLAKERGE